MDLKVCRSQFFSRKIPATLLRQSARPVRQSDGLVPWRARTYGGQALAAFPCISLVPSRSIHFFGGGAAGDPAAAGAGEPAAGAAPGALLTSFNGWL